MKLLQNLNSNFFASAVELQLRLLLTEVNVSRKEKLGSRSLDSTD